MLKGITEFLKIEGKPDYTPTPQTAEKRPPKVEYVEFDGTLKSLEMIRNLLHKVPHKTIKIFEDKMGRECGYIKSYHEAMLCGNRCLIFIVMYEERNYQRYDMPYGMEGNLKYVNNAYKGNYVVLHQPENRDERYFSVMPKCSFDAEYKT